MKTDRDLEQSLEELARLVRPPASIVEQVMHRVDAENPPAESSRAVQDSAEVAPAIADEAQRRTPPGYKDPGRRFKSMMRERSVQYGALAAAILLALGLGTYYLKGSLDGARLALADVISAVAEQSWVHVKYDNGRERWISLHDGRSYFKNEDDVVFLDSEQGIRRTYYTNPRYEPRAIMEDRITPWDPPATAWEAVIAPYEKALDDQSSPYHDVETYEDRIDDRTLVRFDVYHKGVTGDRILIQQIWADPQTHLPVRITERLQLARREEQGREWISGDYDFPATGPASLYDLGVPQDAEIINLDAAPDPGVQEIIDAEIQARDAFPDHYCAVVWRTPSPTLKLNGSEIDVIYRSGVKIRQARYFNMDSEHPDYHLPLPATVDQVLAWTSTQVPVNVGLFDGQNCYNRRGPFPPMFADQSEPMVHVNRRSNLLNKSNRPDYYQWSYSQRNSSGLEISPNPSVLDPGCLVLSWTGGGSSREFHIDPNHDYICVREISWKEISGQWVKEREDRLLDLAQLRGGQWYATKKQSLQYDDSGAAQPSYEDTWNVDIRVMEEGEYPVDAFDPQPLLEGATIEEY